MDPNETLERIRELVAEWAETRHTGPVAELAEYVEALDQWLTRGGFLPDAWRTGPGAVHVREYGGEVTS